MHVRRAILLFAVILALAAVVASLSEPARVPRDGQAAERAAPPPTVPRTPEVRFDVSEPARRRIEIGSSATVLVSVDRPGHVELVGLGREAFAEPGVPARFELFEEEPGEAAVRFTPTDESKPRRAGTLVVGPGANL